MVYYGKSNFFIGKSTMNGHFLPRLFFQAALALSPDVILYSAAVSACAAQRDGWRWALELLQRALRQRAVNQAP